MRWRGVVVGGIWSGGTLTCRYRLSPVSARSVRRRRLLPLPDGVDEEGEDDEDEEQRASSGGIPSAEPALAGVPLPLPGCICWC